MTFFSFGLLLALHEFLNFELLGNPPEIGTPGAFWEGCECKVVMLTFISHLRKVVRALNGGLCLQSVPPTF